MLVWEKTPPCRVLSLPFLPLVGPTTPSAGGWDLQPDNLQPLLKGGFWGGGDADSWGTLLSPLHLSNGALKPVLEDAFPGKPSEGWMRDGWFVRPWSGASVHHGSDHHPRCFTASSRAQFGGSGGNPLAPAMPEVGADSPSGLTWRPSTSEALPALWGLAYGLRASPAVPRAMGGRAQRIFGAHHQSRCPWGGGRWSVSGGREGWGVEGSRPWGRASLSQQRKARR